MTDIKERKKEREWESEREKIRVDKSIYLFTKKCVRVIHTNRKRKQVLFWKQCMLFLLNTEKIILAVIIVLLNHRLTSGMC